MSTPTRKQVQALVQDAMKVQQYPLETQEGFLELVVQRAISLGYQLAADDARVREHQATERRGFVR